MTEQRRLPFSIFDIPITELRCGYLTAVYFWRSKQILEKYHPNRKGVMQVFNKQLDAMVCGVDEALAILRLGAGRWSDEDRKERLFKAFIKCKTKSQKFRELA